MMNHDDAVELLAPLALDALEREVRASVEEHVATCPRCQMELDGHREVAAALGNTYEAPPDQLWEKISSRLYERQGATSVPTLELVGLAGATRVRPSGLRRRSAQVMAGITFAAAAAIVALGVSLASANGHVNHLQHELSGGALASALATPGHEVVTLTGANDRTLATFVTLPDGRGYLMKSTLPTLGVKQTYQLWGIVKGSPVSIGVMGRSPKHVTFTLASSPGPTVLGVTVEPAGGALEPAKVMVASGAV